MSTFDSTHMMYDWMGSSGTLLLVELLGHPEGNGIPETDSYHDIFECGTRVQNLSQTLPARCLCSRCEIFLVVHLLTKQNVKPVIVEDFTSVVSS